MQVVSTLRVWKLEPLWEVILAEKISPQGKLAQADFCTCQGVISLSFTKKPQKYFQKMVIHLHSDDMKSSMFILEKNVAISIIVIKKSITTTTSLCVCYGWIKRF